MVSLSNSKTHEWFLQLIWLDATHKERLTRAQGLHQSVKRLLELRAKSW